MQNYFHDLANLVSTSAHAGEVTFCWLAAETSDFIRFNKNAVRQAGAVKQVAVTLALVVGAKRAEMRIMCTGTLAHDHAEITSAIASLRNDVTMVPDDPYLLYNTAVESTTHVVTGKVPDADAVISNVIAAGQGTDLVGIYAGGAIYRGFANSLGQRNWHHVDNFNFEWCLYHAADKAVKSSYAGADWQAGALNQKMQFARQQLAKLSAPATTLKPGEYRAFFTPSALGEVIEMFNWGGFGVKSQRNKQSPLQKMIDDGQSLHSSFSLAENTRDGLAPAFSEDGYIKAPHVALIKNGRMAESLVSPRSAKEYGIATNGASADEGGESFDLRAGTLAQADALKALDTGIFVGNLWYLNFSDRANCRMTGMTRFATFWVENGEIKAPLNVMRFDDTAYNVMGTNLISLTAERDFMPDSASYGERSTASSHLPGALVSSFKLTL